MIERVGGAVEGRTRGITYAEFTDALVSAFGL
jgi:hypothetical protein